MAGREPRSDPASGRPVLVVHFGIDRADPGGMAAMLRDIERSPVADRYRLSFITSYRHAAGPTRRLLIFAVAILRLVAVSLRRGDRVVHIHVSVRGSWYRKATAVVVARLLRQPVVLQLHAGPVDIAEFWSRLGRLRRSLVGAAFRRADRVLSVSAAGAQSLHECFGMRDVLVVPNAAPPPRTVRQATTRPDSGLVGVLYAGGFRDASKGGQVMLDALPALADAGVTVDLAGPGSPPPEAAAVLSNGRARWIGWLDEDAKAAALDRADIVTLPSLSEGLPIWLLEAMINRKAVVATRTGGIPEVVTDGVDGVLVAPGDPAALARAVRRLAGDRAARERLAAAAHQRAVRLNHAEVYGPLLEVYAAAAAGRAVVTG